MDVLTLTVAIGALLIFYGYCKLVYFNARNQNNYSLTRWMFTGGLPEFLVGLFKGISNIFLFQLDQNSKASLILFIGVLLIVIAIKTAQ